MSLPTRRADDLRAEKEISRSFGKAQDERVEVRAKKESGKILSIGFS